MVAFLTNEALSHSQCTCPLKMQEVLPQSSEQPKVNNSSMQPPHTPETANADT